MLVRVLVTRHVLLLGGAGEGGGGVGGVGGVGVGGGGGGAGFLLLRLSFTSQLSFLESLTAGRSCVVTRLGKAEHAQKRKQSKKSRATTVVPMDLC